MSCPESSGRNCGRRSSSAGRWSGGRRLYLTVIRMANDVGRRLGCWLFIGKPQPLVDEYVWTGQARDTSTFGKHDLMSH